MCRLFFKCTGSPEILIENNPVKFKRKKSLALLIFLKLKNSSFSRETLADIFWPELDSIHARANLRNILSECRNLFGVDILQSYNNLISLNADTIQTDVETILNATKSGTKEDLLKAEKIYKGEFFQGFNLPDCPVFDDWQFEISQQILIARIKILEKLILIFTKKPEEAVKYAFKLTETDPLREDYQLTLLKLLNENLEFTEALRRFSIYRKRLQKEGEPSPGSEITKLADEIRKKQFHSKKDNKENPAPGNLKLLIKKALLPAISGIIVSGLLIFIVFAADMRKEKLPVPIAVMPFEFLCDQPEVEEFARSFTMDMINELAEEEAFIIKPFRTVAAYRETCMSVNEIGKKLDVKYILDGIAQKYNTSIRFSVQLIDIENDKCVWTGTYDCSPENSLETQDKVIGYLKKNILIQFRR